MHKKIALTISAYTLLACSLIAINIGISKKINRSVQVAKISQNRDTLMDGDIIFQTSIEGQGKAIQLATGSVYTHVAVLFKQDGNWMVYEAVQPVSRTPLNVFIKNGDSSKYVIKRLANRDSLLNMDKLANMKTYVNAQLGKDYDPYFNWSDSTMYCSELVWKCYRKSGIVLSELKSLKSYQLSHPLVKKVLSERYGKKIPLEEKVVSPADIFNSDKLVKVAGN